jgi:hypothetical protein
MASVPRLPPKSSACQTVRVTDGFSIAPIFGLFFQPASLVAAYSCLQSQVHLSSQQHIAAVWISGFSLWQNIVLMLVRELHIVSLPNSYLENKREVVTKCRLKAWSLPLHAVSVYCRQNHLGTGHWLVTTDRCFCLPWPWREACRMEYLL